MEKYFNKKLYTDVQSWKVIELDEVKGEATVIAVEKEPQNLEFVEGGFAAHCVNNYEAFQNAPIVEVKGAQPFKVYRKKDGVWYKKNKVGYSLDKRFVDLEDLKSKIEDNEVIEVDEFSVNVLKVKKNGEFKTSFSKFGEMEDVCRYFYDYNF